MRPNYIKLKKCQCKRSPQLDGVLITDKILKDVFRRTNSTYPDLVLSAETQPPRLPNTMKKSAQT